MFSGKNIKQPGLYVLSMLFLGASSASAHAADHYFTASIDRHWIRSVKQYPRPGIFLNMKYPSRLAYLSEHQGSALYL
jgi:hypothetical protein